MEFHWIESNLNIESTALGTNLSLFGWFNDSTESYCLAVYELLLAILYRGVKDCKAHCRVEENLTFEMFYV